MRCAARPSSPHRRGPPKPRRRAAMFRTQGRTRRKGGSSRALRSPEQESRAGPLATQKSRVPAVDAVMRPVTDRRAPSRTLNERPRWRANPGGSRQSDAKLAGSQNPRRRRGSCRFARGCGRGRASRTRRCIDRHRRCLGRVIGVGFVKALHPAPGRTPGAPRRRIQTRRGISDLRRCDSEARTAILALRFDLPPPAHSRVATLVACANSRRRARPGTR